MRQNKLPVVSVIIPTRNSLRTIEQNLKSIKAQTYPKKEIIVVDQESKDGTIGIAKKYADHILTAKADVFYSAPPVSRNIGARASKGKYLLHMDSDMQLTPGILKECVDLLENNPDVLALKIHEKDIGEGFWSQAKMLERKCYVGYDAIEAARFIRRDIFFKLGGYDESLRSAEDWDMSERIRKIGQIGVAKSIINHHLGRMRYFYQVKKKFDYGLTLESMLQKHRFTMSRNLRMVFRSAYFKNWRLFIKNPLATIGFIILRTSELIAYAAGMIWARLNKIKI